MCEKTVFIINKQRKCLDSCPDTFLKRASEFTDQGTYLMECYPDPSNVQLNDTRCNTFGNGVCVSCKNVYFL